eukprot:17145-Heterococcus_DN1.PRE.1
MTLILNVTCTTPTFALLQQLNNNPDSSTILNVGTIDSNTITTTDITTSGAATDTNIDMDNSDLPGGGDTPMDIKQQHGQRSQYDSIPEDLACDDDLTAIDTNNRTFETGTAASTESDHNHAAHAGAGNTVN